MSWQLWVLISGVLTGLGQMIGKSQIHKISALQMGVLRDVSGWIVALLLWIYAGTGWAGITMWMGMMNGALIAVGVALYFIAVRTSFSGTSVFGYLISQVMIVVSSAIVFGEWIYFDPMTWQGRGNLGVLGLTVIAMLLYLQSLKSGRKWMGILVASALINVVGNMVAKYFVSGETAIWPYFFAEQTGLMLAGVGILMVRGQNLIVGRVNALIGVVQGLVAIMGPIIYLYILSEHPLSLASLVRRIAAILVTSISGLWWYREGKNLGWRGVLSLILAILAFGLVMIVNR